MVSQIREMHIPTDNWYNKNNTTEKVFVTQRLYFRRREEHDP